MRDQSFDLIVIGSGPGGATLAQRLAPTGKRILILERGNWLRRSPDNWSARSVFVDNAYQARETWYDKAGTAFHPGLHYFVGGNSKLYGAALFRLRARDFEALQHADGVSPEWPMKYDVFAPYYDQAEKLFHVHGAAGEDPTEPPRSAPYAYPPVAHEPRMQQLSDTFTQHGLHPFHMPLGILLDEADGVVARHSPCIRCGAFDGYPCPTNGKADAEIMCIDPMLAAHPNVTLLTGAYASKLGTDPSGHTVNAVQVERGGTRETYSADIVVIACGALSSALLLLRSANDKHPHGLANGSDQVGRNYIRHNQSVLMAITRESNDTVFQKTVGVSDFYFGADDWPHPMGVDPDDRQVAPRHDSRRGAARMAGLAAGATLRIPRPALAGLLAFQRRPAAPGKPHPLRRRARGGRADRQQHGSAPAPARETRGIAGTDRRTPAPHRAHALPRQGHSDWRHRAPGGHRALRP
jgi:choline dehydrogenase-like flavoprotein